MTSDLEHLRNAQEEALARSGRSFHWARGLLNRRHGLRATRLYAFCRHLDDLADGHTFSAAARPVLTEVGRALQTGRSDDPAVADMIGLMRDCGIDPQIPCELVQGQVSDLEPVAMGSVDELLRYCYRVAGTVGLMMCDVLEVTEPAAAPFAIDLGVAMQLTNVCRDVQEDARMGRRYLPSELVGNLPPEQLICPPVNLQIGLKTALERLLDLADEYYRSGESGLPFLPLRARHGILVAARVYRAIGVELRARDCRFWDGRTVISGPRKFGVTARALGVSLVGSRFWKRPGRHRAELHRALGTLPGTDFHP